MVHETVFIGKKVMQFVFMMFILSIIVFYMSRLSPGDPLLSYYGEGVERMNTVQKQLAMSKLGLEDPVPLILHMYSKK